jgi:hypothetical protein
LRTIIAGCRDIFNGQYVREAIAESGFEITEVVCGGASGVDLLGKDWAEKHKIPVKMFPADWDKNGKAAGPIRNAEMANYAEALVAVWDEYSKGTKDMIDKAKAKGLKVYVKIV